MDLIIPSVTDSKVLLEVAVFSYQPSYPRQLQPVFILGIAGVGTRHSLKRKDTVK